MNWLTFSIMVALLFTSAFFAASETALTGASRASMLRLSKQGNKDADVVSSLFGMRERLIGALLRQQHRQYRRLSARHRHFYRMVR